MSCCIDLRINSHTLETGNPAIDQRYTPPPLTYCADRQSRHLTLQLNQPPVNGRIGVYTMSLNPGTRFGHCDMTALIVEGDMVEKLGFTCVAGAP